MAFFTITVAPGLSREEHARAVRVGPSRVAAAHDMPTLLIRAGFTDVRETEVTDQYLTTARTWLRTRDEHRAELERIDPERLAQQQRDMAEAVAAIQAGLLRRSLLEASRGP